MEAREDGNGSVGTVAVADGVPATNAACEKAWAGRARVGTADAREGWGVSATWSGAASSKARGAGTQSIAGVGTSSRIEVDSTLDDTGGTDDRAAARRCDRVEGGAEPTVVGAGEAPTASATRPADAEATPGRGLSDGDVGSGRSSATTPGLDGFTNRDSSRP